MAKIVCVLKSGGEFKASHVQALAKSARRHNPSIPFFCLTDIHIPGINTIPLKDNFPGWWSKLELFREFKNEQVLYLDLDSIIMGDISELFREKLTMLKDVNNLESFGSGVMSWKGDYSYIYDAFKKSPHTFIKEYKTTKKWGDQGFIMNHLKETPDSFNFGPLHSYKAHCKNGVPAGTKLVFFHGKPRPWETDLYKG